MDYWFSKELLASDLLTPLAQLVRLQVEKGAPGLRFEKHLSLNWLDYRFGTELLASDLLPPLTYLVKLQVEKGAPSLRFVNPSRSTR